MHVPISGFYTVVIVVLYLPTVTVQAMRLYQSHMNILAIIPIQCILKRLINPFLE